MRVRTRLLTANLGAIPPTNLTCSWKNKQVQDAWFNATQAMQLLEDTASHIHLLLLLLDRPLWFSWVTNYIHNFLIDWFSLLL